MKISEDSKDTLNRIALAQHLSNKYPGAAKYVEIYNFCMTINNLKTAEKRFVLLTGVKR